MDAKRASRGHEESVLASHPTLPRTADDLPKHEQSKCRIPTSTVRRSLRGQITQRRCWKTSPVSEGGSCRYCRASSVGVHGATMTRTGRDRQRGKIEHQQFLRPGQIVLSLFEFLLKRTCKYFCLCARVKGIRKRGRVRIAPCLSAMFCAPSCLP